MADTNTFPPAISGNPARNAESVHAAKAAIHAGPGRGSDRLRRIFFMQIGDDILDWAVRTDRNRFEMWAVTGK